MKFRLFLKGGFPKLKSDNIVVINAHKNIFRVNKDCSQIMAEVQDVRAATDEVGRSKVCCKKLSNPFFKIIHPVLGFR